MVWLNLALKNLLRRKIRTSLTVLGVAIAIAVLFTMVQAQGGYEKGLRRQLDALGAHILIVPKGCPYEAATIVLHGGKWPRYMKQEYIGEVKGAKGVAQAAAILMDAIVARGERRENLIFLGIERDYARLRPKWEYSSGGWFSGPNAEEVILGKSVAEGLGLAAGGIYHHRQDKVGKAGGKKDGDLKVAGVLEKTNTQDDGFFFLPLATLQRLFNLPGKIVVILVKVRRLEMVEEVAEALKALPGNMNVFPLSELLKTATSVIQSSKAFVLAIVLVAVAIGAVGVLNTILMTVFERTKEIGMMKAVGASRMDIFRLIWLETILICASGGAMGIGLAMASARGVESFLNRLLYAGGPFLVAMEGGLIQFSAKVALVCLAFSVALGLAAGWYPAHRAASVKPIEAIRTE